MDQYLISIILPMLRKLRDDGHSHPGNMTEKQWTEILNKIIKGFEAAEEILDDVLVTDVDKYRKEIDKNEKIFQEGMKLFSQHFFVLWD
jgi:hypothetical protein